MDHDLVAHQLGRRDHARLVGEVAARLELPADDDDPFGTSDEVSA